MSLGSFRHISQVMVFSLYRVAGRMGCYTILVVIMDSRILATGANR